MLKRLPQVARNSEQYAITKKVKSWFIKQDLSESINFSVRSDCPIDVSSLSGNEEDQKKVIQYIRLPENTADEPLWQHVPKNDQVDEQGKKKLNGAQLYWGTFLRLHKDIRDTALKHGWITITKQQ